MAQTTQKTDTNARRPIASGNIKKTDSTPGSGSVQLVDIFREYIQPAKAEETEFHEQMKEGTAFFNKWNESRLELAFASFDNSMKRALFEIIYLLNINDAKFKEWKYKIFQPSSKKVQAEKEKTIDLFVEGSPCGVKGIADLSAVFKDEYQTYINDTFGEAAAPPSDDTGHPIEGIYSIGSIGTVGHKNIDSDLDLQIQYNLQPFNLDLKKRGDQHLLQILMQKIQEVKRQQAQKNNVGKTASPDELEKKLDQLAQRQIKKKYPTLHQHLISQEKNIAAEIVQGNNRALKSKLTQEISDLLKHHAPNLKKKEALLLSRIEKIQNYINDKFPEAEIYLFSFSRQKLRRGYFGSTLESKESSGGAYELILNYETLFPGIYFTPVVPSHFLFSAAVNNNEKQFDRLNELIEFRLNDKSDHIAANVNNQGPTPDLDPLYVAAHSAAAYWEAFKGSSGNLPKATLNLLRFEMLLEKKLNKTNIQMVKQPDALDRLILPSKEKAESQNPISFFRYPVGKYLLPAANEVKYNEAGPHMNFPPDKLKAFEDQRPKLLQDPWWLRYKTLKIAYGRPGLVPGIPDKQIPGISDILDLAFALHIRVSDVFSVIGRDFSGHREKTLSDYLATVFPKDSPQRNKLNALFIGDIQTVSEFEKELRFIFQNSVDRIHDKVSKLNINANKKTSEELKIWRHYYKQSFQAPPNVIQKSILNHLQVPRGRLQIGFKKSTGWFFRSLQKGISRGKRFESTILNLLPEEIILIEDPFFLKGLVYCVINGYYGIFNRGQLNETTTAIEYDRRHINLGSKLDNDQAFISPDQLERIMKAILRHFPDRKVSYLDCISKDRKIKEVMIFLNLLKYGQISMLYRDNLNTYFADQFFIPSFQKNHLTYATDYRRMLTTQDLQMQAQLFFKEKRINPLQVELAAWVNPNSAETSHAASQTEAKEKLLGEEFKKTILKESGKVA